MLIYVLNEVNNTFFKTEKVFGYSGILIADKRRFKKTLTFPFNFYP